MQRVLGLGLAGALGGLAYYGAQAVTHPPRGPHEYDVIVIGGGVVGLSVSRTLALLDQAVLLIDAAPQPAASPASSGNSGIGCTGDSIPMPSLCPSPSRCPCPCPCLSPCP